MNRRGHRIARCTVHRLMRTEGLRGISRAKGPRTTIPGRGPDTRPDLLDRDFQAPAPDRVWVADITYCWTFAGWVYAAFVVDVYSRRVVGWQLSKSLRTDLALDALEMGPWTRAHAGRDTTGVIAHSDKGVQYLAVRYTRSTRFSKLSWSATRAPGRASTTSSSPSRSTSTGSTTDDSTARSDSSHQSSSKSSTTGKTPWRLPSLRQFRVSTEPGTRHLDRDQVVGYSLVRYAHRHRSNRHAISGRHGRAARLPYGRAPASFRSRLR